MNWEIRAVRGDYVPLGNIQPRAPSKQQINHPSLYRVVYGHTITCTCGAPTGSGLPCVHVMAYNQSHLSYKRLFVKEQMSTRWFRSRQPPAAALAVVNRRSEHLVELPGEYKQDTGVGYDDEHSTLLVEQFEDHAFSLTQSVIENVRACTQLGDGVLVVLRSLLELTERQITGDDSMELVFRKKPGRHSLMVANPAVLTEGQRRRHANRGEQYIAKRLCRLLHKAEEYQHFPRPQLQPKLLRSRLEEPDKAK